MNQRKTKWLSLSGILFAFLTLVASGVNAQTNPSGDSTPQPGAMNQQPPASPPKNDSIIVTRFEAVENGGGSINLDDYIMVYVQNLPALYSSPGHDRDQIVLYIDGVAMHGINPVFENRNGNKLLFKLVRDSSTAASWAVFYEAPRPKPGEKMTLSVGYEHDKPMPSRIDNFQMEFVYRTALWWAIIAIIAIVVICVWLSMKTQIIRDKPDMVKDASGNMIPAVKNPPYSLARTQIMFWTAISAVSFIFIWAVTLDIPEITNSTLILLTVSVGTTAGARLIDFNQDDNPDRHQNKESVSFFRDILSDEKGISIHRLQMVLWMLIVGVYFLNVTYTYLYMPSLDDTLLALMGISSGTYVGLKMTENKKTPVNTNTNTNTPS